MTIGELNKKIKELKELKKFEAEVKEAIENLENEIKAEMTERNTEELETDTYIVRWTTVLSNRFDTTAFKKVMPDVYKVYTKQVTSRRFTISD